MGTKQSAVGNEETDNTGSTSKKAKKTVLIKKKRSKSSKAAIVASDPVIYVGSPEQKKISDGGDLQGRIAVRAHELYEQRGGCHGEDQADWFEAERQILSTV